MRKKVFVVISSVMLGLLMNITLVRADFYKWIDDKGDFHFTDEYSNMPEKYLSVIEIRKTPIERSVPSVNKQPIPELLTEDPNPVKQETSVLFRGMISGIDRTARTIVVTGAEETMVFPAPEDTSITTYSGKQFPFAELRTEMWVVVEHLQKGKDIHVLKIKVESMPSGVQTTQRSQGEIKYEAPKYEAPKYEGPKYIGPKYEGNKYKAKYKVRKK